MIESITIDPEGYVMILLRTEADFQRFVEHVVPRGNAFAAMRTAAGQFRVSWKVDELAQITTLRLADPTPAAPVRCFKGTANGLYAVSPSGDVTFFTDKFISNVSHITTSEIIATTQIPITPTEALTLLSDWPEGKAELERMLGVKHG